MRDPRPRTPAASGGRGRGTAERSRCTFNVYTHIREPYTPIRVRVQGRRWRGGVDVIKRDGQRESERERER